MLWETAPYWEEKIHERGRNEGISIGRNEGISIGRNEGIAMGMQGVLLSGLEARFGILPAQAVDAIRRITDRQVLDDLAKTAFTAQSMEQFCARLPGDMAR